MKTSCLYVLLQIVIISSQAVTSLLADESYQAFNTTKDGVTKCPSYFSFRFWDEFNVFFDCKNLTWSACSAETDYLATFINPRTQTICSIKKVLEPEYGDPFVSMSCPPDCSDDCKCDFLYYLGNSELPMDSCIPYINDKNCPVPLLYVRHENLTWTYCHEGNAFGNLTNPKNKEVCAVIAQSWGSSGWCECPPCGHLQITSWGRGDDGFLGIGNDDCEHLELTNDGSCAIPHFKYKGLVWDLG